MRRPPGTGDGQLGGYSDGSAWNNSGAIHRVAPAFAVVVPWEESPEATSIIFERPKSARHASPFGDTRIFAYGMVNEW
jgi:hypothetical protein